LVAKRRWPLYAPAVLKLVHFSATDTACGLGFPRIRQLVVYYDGSTVDPARLGELLDSCGPRLE
jgi:hypothetical protein